MAQEPTTEERIRKQQEALEKIKDVEERGGKDGPEPTRYGDWDSGGGKVVDF